MKFHVLRSLIVPWFIFFVASIAGLVAVGLYLRIEPQHHLPTLYAMAGGAVLCLLFNISTLSRAGIWIAYSLPFSLRTTSRPWIVRAFLSMSVAVLFYLVSHASWMPMIWQGAVVPAIFTIALFVALWHVLGPLLRWASTMPFSRTIVFIFSLPLFATVPVTALFLGQTIFDAYQASQPDFLVLKPEDIKPIQVAEETPSDETVASEAPAAPETLAEKRALDLKTAAESGAPCPDESRNIQRALDPSVAEDITYWAIKALRCANMKAVVALPRLVNIMQSSQSSTRLRAEAIHGMTLFGTENIKQVAYLLIRRISADEPVEVIAAAASAFAKLPEEDRQSAVRRLTSLLDNVKTSGIAAELLTKKFRKPELVTEYVAEHLNAESDRRDQAVSMICLLPKEGRDKAAEMMPEIIASVKTGEVDDPVMKTLECLGEPAFAAIRQEVLKPQRMDKVIAARALATLGISETPEAIETASACAKDGDERVRRYCSESLGKIGGPALPKILELLSSKDQNLKETGKNALEHFADLDAKDDLLRIREENSGWLANQRKIQIARAIDTALVKLERKERQSKNENSAPQTQE